MGNSYDHFNGSVSSEALKRQDAETLKEFRTEPVGLARDQHLTGLDALPTDEFLRIVGLRVRAQRSTLRMSRKRLAEVSGVSERYLAQLESGQGNMSIALLRKVTASIGITLGALLSAEMTEESDQRHTQPQNGTHIQPSFQTRVPNNTNGRSLGQSPNGADAVPSRARLVSEF